MDKLFSYNCAPMMAARSTILCEYPASLSYQESTFTIFSMTYVVSASTMDDRVDPVEGMSPADPVLPHGAPGMPTGASPFARWHPPEMIFKTVSIRLPQLSDRADTIWGAGHGHRHRNEFKASNRPVIWKYLRRLRQVLV